MYGENIGNISSSRQETRNGKQFTDNEGTQTPRTLQNYDLCGDNSNTSVAPDTKMIVLTVFSMIAWVPIESSIVIEN